MRGFHGTVKAICDSNLRFAAQLPSYPTPRPPNSLLLPPPTQKQMYSPLPAEAISSLPEYMLKYIKFKVAQAADPSSSDPSTSYASESGVARLTSFSWKLGAVCASGDGGGGGGGEKRVYWMTTVLPQLLLNTSFFARRVHFSRRRGAGWEGHGQCVHGDFEGWREEGHRVRAEYGRGGQA